MDDTTQTDALSPEEAAQKIQSLRDMISSAEKTIHGAKSMLLQLEGKKKAGRRRKVDSDDGSRVIEGAFDGQLMIGTDGKQYPVPANYASKSKLIEGDNLKLSITPDGSFIYKQIGPAPRQNHIGIVAQDENGNYYVTADGKNYKILLASITYFKVEPGDEVVVVSSQEDTAQWAAIESVLQQAKDGMSTPTPSKAKESFVKEPPIATPTPPQETVAPAATTTADSKAIIDEWAPDIEEIEKEIRQEMQTSHTQK